MAQSWLASVLPAFCVAGFQAVTQHLWLGTVDLVARPWNMFNRVGNAPRARRPVTGEARILAFCSCATRPAGFARAKNVGRNKLAQFRQPCGERTAAMPERRKLVPAYGHPHLQHLAKRCKANVNQVPVQLALPQQVVVCASHFELPVMEKVDFITIT